MIHTTAVEILQDRLDKSRKNITMLRSELSNREEEIVRLTKDIRECEAFERELVQALEFLKARN